MLSVEQVDVHADHSRKALHALCLDVYEGEIVGIAGVAGNGQKEFAEVLTGLRPKSGGTIIFDGKEMKMASVREAIKAGHCSCTGESNAQRACRKFGLYR